MDSDQGKLFIGGISWETSEENLKDYFGSYGEVLQTVIMRDKATGRPRGFGFVVFADPSILDRVLHDKHTIDGRTVEAKRAMSREEQQISSRYGNPNSGRSVPGGANIKTKKIFVGGLPATLTEEGFRFYFENYGHVTDAVIMYDQNTQRPRGFGFISFDTEDAVDRVLHNSYHELNGKCVVVERARPKDANPGSAGRSTGGGGYHDYGGSGGNSWPYDGRIDANRYMQPLAAGGGYPPYGSSGYGAPGYGYGAASNAVGFGGFGVASYGGASAGYGGPAGAYGNAPGVGYASGPPGAPRSQWNNQASSGYVSTGYCPNAGYGAGGWSAPGAGGALGSGGAVPSQAGQSPGGPTAYGNQGYGYGGYGANEGYANPSNYGAGGRPSSTPNISSVGAGDQPGAVAGYMAGGYNNANGNPGYVNNAGWRTGGNYGTIQESGPSGGYGGGYVNNAGWRTGGIYGTIQENGPSGGYGGGCVNNAGWRTGGIYGTIQESGPSGGYGGGYGGNPIQCMKC